jgi:carbon monoxide dehydrogenase subunit G
VKVAGTYALPVSMEKAYEMLQDPAVLADAMPGCDRLEMIGPDEYAMKMKMAIASFSGLFESKVRLCDHAPPTGFTMHVNGQGKVGFVNGEGKISLSPNGSGTVVRYDGDVHVGGSIAAVGQRLIDTTSKMMIKRFFEKLAAAAIADQKV